MLFLYGKRQDNMKLQEALYSIYSWILIAYYQENVDSQGGSDYMSRIWIVTGVSGSGRIEMLNELKLYAEGKGKKVKVLDIGNVIEQKAKERNMPFVLDKILNLDQVTLGLLRALAIQAINKDISDDQESDVIFIGMHALFFWRDRLIPGVSYFDLLSLNPDGIINVVDDVLTIQKINMKNPKWAQEKSPSPASLQRWMMEEELLSDIYASIKGVPMYVLARKQRVENLYSFFFEKKKKIYLSYPITAIREEKEILDRIQNEYKPKLEELFFVFNPLDIMDKTHISQKVKEVEGFLSDESVGFIDARTIDRDFRFISQSDAVVVIYPTDKSSPGVDQEMQHAYSHQIPVYMLYYEKISPFLDRIAEIYDNDEAFFDKLKEFADAQ